MNGPQHYRRAEELLARIKGHPQSPATDNGAPLDHRQVANLIARADAHIRLAMVAAIVSGSDSRMDEDVAAEWDTVLQREALR
jgi:hypothetical protein